MADWVPLGTEEMQAAQDRLGLSNERLAPELYVVSKTWERWKTRGAVPRNQLARVAQVLRLEVESAPLVRVVTAAEANGVEALLEQVEHVIGRLRRIEEALGIPQDVPVAPQSERAVNGHE